MNLFVDAHVFDDSLQGSRTYLKGLYRELIVREKTITFFFGASDIANLRNEFGESENVRFIKLPSGNKYLRLLFYIPFIILRYRIDIAHYQYISPFFKFSVEILTIHDVLFLDFPELFPVSYRFRNKLLFKRSALRADYLLTVSEYSRSRISEHFKINKSKIHVIPNGVSNDFFEILNNDQGIRSRYNLTRYILYVSRIEPRKNQILLLKAFTELRLWEKGYKLVFLGARALPYEDLDDTLSRLQDEIKDNVLFIPGAYGAELRSLYQNCSLFVYPSLAEGFGIPPLEAVASGVPVLCSERTAMCDFSFLGDKLFDPDSSEELKTKMLESLSTGKIQQDKEIEHVRVYYNWKNSAERFASVIFRTT